MSDDIFKSFLDYLRQHPTHFFKSNFTYSVLSEPHGWSEFAKKMLLTLAPSLTEDQQKKFGDDFLDFLHQSELTKLPNGNKKHQIDLQELMFFDKLLSLVAKRPWEDKQIQQMAVLPLPRTLSQVGMLPCNKVPWDTLLSCVRTMTQASAPLVAHWQSIHKKSIQALRKQTSVSAIISSIGHSIGEIKPEVLNHLLSDDQSMDGSPTAEQFFIELENQNLMAKIRPPVLMTLVSHLINALDSNQASRYIQKWFNDPSDLGTKLLGYARVVGVQPTFYPNDGTAFSSWPAELLYQWKCIQLDATPLVFNASLRSMLSGLLEGFTSNHLSCYIQMSADRCSKLVIKQFASLEGLEEFLDKMQSLPLPKKNHLLLLTSLSKNPIWSKLEPSRQEWVQDQLQTLLSTPLLDNKKQDMKHIRALSSGALSLIWHRLTRSPNAKEAEVLCEVLAYPCSNPTPLVNKVVRALRAGLWSLPKEEVEKMRLNLSEHQELELTTATSLSQQSSRPKTKM